MEREGSIRPENSAPLASRWSGMSGKTAATSSLQTISSVTRSQIKAAWPSEARMVDSWGTTGAKIASFRDRALSDSRTSNIGPFRPGPYEKFINIPETTSGDDLERSKPDWHGFCDQNCSKGRNVPKRDSSGVHVRPRSTKAGGRWQHRF